MSPDFLVAGSVARDRSVRAAGGRDAGNGGRLLMTQGDDFKFQVRPISEPANDQGRDRGDERGHVGDTTAANRETLAFYSRLEF